MTAPVTCPHCSSQLHYERDGVTYSRVLRIEVPDVYSGVLMHRCPDCTRFWHRFEPGTRLRLRAQELLDEWGLS